MWMIKSKQVRCNIRLVDLLLWAGLALEVILCGNQFFKSMFSNSDKIAQVNVNLLICILIDFPFFLSCKQLILVQIGILYCTIIYYFQYLHTHSVKPIHLLLSHTLIDSCRKNLYCNITLSWDHIKYTPVKSSSGSTFKTGKTEITYFKKMFDHRQLNENNWFDPCVCVPSLRTDHKHTYH